jgi:hypothetical protein
LWSPPKARSIKVPVAEARRTARRGTTRVHNLGVTRSGAARQARLGRLSRLRSPGLRRASLCSDRRPATRESSGHAAGPTACRVPTGVLALAGGVFHPGHPAASAFLGALRRATNALRVRHGWGPYARKAPHHQRVDGALRRATTSDSRCDVASSPSSLRVMSTWRGVAVCERVRDWHRRRALNDSRDTSLWSPPEKIDAGLRAALAG